MTIDMENFEMTLEVLGEVDEAVNFFKSYETETQKDLDAMRNYISMRDWTGLKRICHTWKGRNAQIGFCKSSFLASSLHDFLQNTCIEGGHNPLIEKQVQVFFDTIERECQEITCFLKSQYLL